MASTAPTPITRPKQVSRGEQTQPTLPGLEAYAVTKRLVAVSGSFELAPEYETDAAFMDYLEANWGQQVHAILTWANTDGVTMRASLTFTVSDSRNVFHEDAEGEAGRIKRIGLKAAELGLGEA